MTLLTQHLTAYATVRRELLRSIFIIDHAEIMQASVYIQHPTHS